MTRIRTMTEQDVASVMRIQCACYAPSMVEPEATIRHRFREFSDTAWVAEDEQGICAYLVAYGSRMGTITPLGAPFARYDAVETLYLHDLAVSPQAKGQGVAKRLVDGALEYAAMRGLCFSSLVSVQGSRRFWQGFGFEDWEALEPSQRSHLMTYESGACYMVRRLASSTAQ